MRLLEERILKDGKVFPGKILKVSGFLNHLVDIELLFEMGEEVARLFAEEKITKILTIEASGIPLAVACGKAISVPILFAKKTKSLNINDNTYKANVFSYTHNREYIICVEKDLINSDDTILIVDDFLANGEAIKGLQEIITQAGATLAGCAIAIEKGFQGGGDKLRESGVKVESLAIVKEMNDSQITF